MEFTRYLNGKTVTAGELSRLSLTTPELLCAVRDAEARSTRQAASSVEKGGRAPSYPEERTAPARRKTHG
jgi:hypothetical protein